MLCCSLSVYLWVSSKASSGRFESTYESRMDVIRVFVSHFCNLHRERSVKRYNIPRSSKLHLHSNTSSASCLGIAFAPLFLNAIKKSRLVSENEIALTYPRPSTGLPKVDLDRDELHACICVETPHHAAGNSCP